MICMPRDFRNKTFQKTLRGYAPDEVNEYIAYINEEYRKMEKRLINAARKIEELKKAAEQYPDDQDVEQPIQPDVQPDAAAEAEAEKILAEAAAKAEAILKAAEEEAENVKSEAQKIRGEAVEYSDSERKKADDYSRQVVKSAKDKALAICTRVTQFKDTLFDEYSSHIEQIENISAEADELARSFENQEETTPVDNTSARKGISSLAESLITASAEITAGEIPESDDALDEAEPKEDLYIDLDEVLDEYDQPDPASAEPETPANESDGDHTLAEEAPQPDVSEPEAQKEPVETPAPEPEPDPAPAEPEIKDEDLIRKEQLDRFFGILNDDDLTPDENEPNAPAENPADPALDDPAVIDEIINGVLSGDESATRELDLGELIRMNRKATAQPSPEQNKPNSPTESEPEENADFNEGENDGEYIDVDSIISHGVVKQDLSLTDEFDIVFSDKNSKKSVEEIRRQPTIAPRAPSKNPRKIIKKHNK